MTATAGAPLTRSINWKTIIWSTVENHVSRLQLRIAKAIKMGRYGKAKALQWLLTHSFYAKLLAVRKVTQNAGKYTAGVDNITWKTD
ncbi:MAG: reverse transcriptase N-terminal domain-containing protein [Parachlamydiaceae bacterium]